MKNSSWIFGFLLSVLLLPVSATAQINVLGGLRFEHNVEPGGMYEGKIQVHNPTDEVQEVRVYKVDYLFFADHTSKYEAPGTMARSNAPWVTLIPERMTIPPDAVVEVGYTITMPTGPAADTLDGVYWSLVLVEPIPKTSPESVFSTPDTLGTLEERLQTTFTTTTRFGIQLITQFPGTGLVDVHLANPQVVDSTAGRILTIDAENTGEQLVRTTVWVECYDATGALAGTFEGRGGGMYPGASRRYSIDISALPKGVYKALVVVDAGNDNVFGTQLDLVL